MEWWYEYILVTIWLLAVRRFYGQEAARIIEVELGWTESRLERGLYFFRAAWWALTDRDSPARRRQIDRLAEQLRHKLSETSRLRTGYFERRIYSRDLARVPAVMEKALFHSTPHLVVQPGAESDILEILNFAREQNLPVYPRGVASSAFGGVIPTRNGIVIDLSPMNKILEIDAEQQTVRVQPGVRWANLDEQLAPNGLTTITAPSSRFSTVGGWASTGGLGLNGYRYGRFADAIVSARVVLPNGTLLELNGDDKKLNDFVGTEGQLGIITELTMRTRPKPGFAKTFLFYFKDVAAAFDFIRRLSAAGHQPAHVMYYDRARLAEENRLFRDKTRLDENIVEERDAVLLHFDDEQLAEKLSADNDLSATAEPAAGPAAQYLWAERYFPFKGQRLGPNLLACELLLPGAFVPQFVEQARKLAQKFGIHPAIEVIVSRVGDADQCVLIASFTCDFRRRISYFVRLMFVQFLLRLGVTWHGSPYGFGIWNAPFIHAHYPEAELRELIRRKSEYDPEGLLNPDKFFSVRTRFFNLPGLMFRPRLFEAALKLALSFTPIWRRLARIPGANGNSQPRRGAAVPHPGWQVPKLEENGGRRLLAESALRCTNCGSCIGACPAYLLTGDELVTGRSKLRLAEALEAREQVQAAEGHSPFQCLRCGLCEEVCQTRLPLRDCYQVLEDRIKERWGLPEEEISRFVALVDERRAWLADTFGLEFPEWSPAESMNGIPAARRMGDGEGR